MSPNPPTEVVRDKEVAPQSDTGVAALAQQMANEVYSDKAAWDVLKSNINYIPTGFKLNNITLDGNRLGTKAASEETPYTPKDLKNLENIPKAPHKLDNKPSDDKQPAVDKPGKGLPENFDTKSQIPPELLRDMPKAPFILGLPDMKNPMTPEIKHALGPDINPQILKGAEPTEKKSIWDEPIWKKPIEFGPVIDPVKGIEKL